MNTAIDDLNPQCQNILLMLDELRRRRTTVYAQALDCIIEKLPTGKELDDIRHHRQAYIESLDATP